MGHKLFDGSFIWSKAYSFKSSPYPGQDSLQQVIIFGDMGKVISTSNKNILSFMLADDGILASIHKPISS